MKNRAVLQTRVFKNRNGKKCFFFMLAAMVIVGGIVYASLDKQGGGGGVQVMETKEPEPVPISIGMWNAQEELVGDELQLAIEEKLNIKLVPVPITYMNWTGEFQKMAATRSLPDIISHDIIGTSTYSTWIEQGLIQKIPNDLSAYPLLEAYMNQPYQQYFRDEAGDIFCIPRITYPEEEMWALDRCIVVRTDWMDRLGIAMPQSFEEFAAMLKRFVTDDPDGNGLDDTGGLSIANMNTYEAIYLGIFPELSNTERGWIKEEGKWMPVYCSERTGEALSYAKRLYDEGLMDYDFAYQNSKDARTRFAEGKSGAIATQFLEIAAVWDELNPDRDITRAAKVMRPWPAEDGNVYRFTTSLHWSETYLNADMSKEKLTKILELYEYLLSGDFQELIEKHPASTHPSAKLIPILVQWSQDKLYENVGAYKGWYTQETLEYARQELEWYRNNTLRLDYNWNVIFMNTPYKDQLPSYKEVQDEMVKVIIGEEDAVTAWGESMEELKLKVPLELAIEEVTKEAAKKGW